MTVDRFHSSPGLEIVHRAENPFGALQGEVLVSVLMPCYNHVETVEQAVRSVLEQTYPPVEVVVVDDGSKDASLAVLQALVADLPPHDADRVTIARKPNGGISAALNDARSLAKGSFLCVLATDDWFIPTKVEVQLRAFEAAPASVAVVHSGAWSVFEKGDLVSMRGRHPPAVGACFEDLLAVRVACIAPTVMVRAHAFDEVGGFDERYVAEDSNFYCRLAQRGYEFLFLDEDLVYKRARRHSLGGQPARWITENLRTLDELGNDLPETTRQQIRAELYHANMRQAMGAGDGALAREMAEGLAGVLGHRRAKQAYLRQRMRYALLGLVPERVRLMLRRLRSTARRTRT